MTFRVKSAQVKKGYLRLVIKREGPKALCIFVGVINLADSRLNCFIQGERISSDFTKKEVSYKFIHEGAAALLPSPAIFALWHWVTCVVRV